MKKALLRNTAMTIAAIAGISSVAHADTVLTTLESMMAASGAPDGAFTYDSVVSDTDTGFEITGVRMEPDPGDGVVSIERLTIDAIDLAAVAADGPPTFLDITAVGVAVPFDMMDSDAQQVFPDGMTFDIGLDYALDLDSQSLALHEFVFSMADIGDVQISADLSGLSMEAIGGAMFGGAEALSDVKLSGASITLNDEGGLRVLFETIAAEEGMDVDGFVTQAMMPQMQMMGGMFAGDPIGAALVDAVVGFVGDYADPGGALTITALPESPVSLMSLMDMADPTGLPSMLGLGASYDGSGGGGDHGAADDDEGGLFGQQSQTETAEAADSASSVTPSEEAAPSDAAEAPASVGDGAFATLMAMAQGAGMPDGSLIYDQVLSDTAESFILSGVRFEPEPGDYVEIEMLSVAQIDMDSIMAGGPPMSLQMAAQGIVLPTDNMDGDMRQVLGEEPVNANLFLDYAFDPATGDFDVNGLTLEMVDLGTLTFTLGMAQIEPEAILDMVMMGPEAISSALLENAALSYTDQGFMQRVIAAAAAEEGVSEEELVAEMFVQMEAIEPMFASDPIASAALDALGEFIEDYADPSGSLGIVLNPPQPVSIGALNDVADPSALPGMLGLVIGY